MSVFLYVGVTTCYCLAHIVKPWLFAFIDDVCTMYRPHECYDVFTHTYNMYDTIVLFCDTTMKLYKYLYLYV